MTTTVFEATYKHGVKRSLGLANHLKEEETVSWFKRHKTEQLEGSCVDHMQRLESKNSTQVIQTLPSAVQRIPTPRLNNITPTNMNTDNNNNSNNNIQSAKEEEVSTLVLS